MMEAMMSLSTDPTAQTTVTEMPRNRSSADKLPVKKISVRGGAKEGQEGHFLAITQPARDVSIEGFQRHRPSRMHRASQIAQCISGPLPCGN